MKNSRDVKTIFWMIIISLASKLSGMLRQLIFSSIFADSTEASAFLASTSLVLSLFDILFSTAIVGCFIPKYLEIKETQDKTNANGFFATFTIFISIITIIISILIFAFSKQIINIFSPALSLDGKVLASTLLKVMAPVPFIAGLTYLLTGVLQSNNKFYIPQSMSIFSNIFIILINVLFVKEATKENAMFLSIAYTFSWMIQFIVLIIPTLKNRLINFSNTYFDIQRIKYVIGKAPLIMVSSWLIPFSTIVSNYFLPFISDASLSIYSYSFNIYLIISGIIIYAITNYLLPNLSKLNQKEDNKEFSSYLKKAILASEAIILPVSILTFLLSYIIIYVLYYHGNFTLDMVKSCSDTLKIITIAMPFFAIFDICSKSFFATKKPLFPAISSVVGISVNIVLNIIFKVSKMGLSLSSIAISFVVSISLSTLVILFFTISYFKKKELK